jgi:uncharacterized protein VirK/YbjX
MSSTDTIWDRIVTPQEPDMPVDVARYFLSISFPIEEKQRYTALAAKVQSELSSVERAELESLVQANTLLMMLQAKARLSLNQHQPAA